jgi:hypothetical protein
MASNVKFDDGTDTAGTPVRLDVHTYRAVTKRLDVEQSDTSEHPPNATEIIVGLDLGTIAEHRLYYGTTQTDWSPVVQKAISQELGALTVRAREHVPTGPKIATDPSTDAKPHRTPSLSLVQLIEYVRTTSPPAYAERLARRLQHLDRISREEYPDQQPLNPDSLLDFAVYVARHPNIRYPDTVLTPSGDIRASWKRNDQDLFAVEFLGNGDVAFVMFSPDTIQKSEVIRMSGYASLQSIDRRLGSFDICRWATGPR